MSSKYFFLSQSYCQYRADLAPDVSWRWSIETDWALFKLGLGHPQNTNRHKGCFRVCKHTATQRDVTQTLRLRFNCEEFRKEQPFRKKNECSRGRMAEIIFNPP